MRAPHAKYIPLSEKLGGLQMIGAALLLGGAVLGELVRGKRPYADENGK